MSDARPRSNEKQMTVIYLIGSFVSNYPSGGGVSGIYLPSLLPATERESNVMYTRRMIEVAALLAEGMSRRRIADVLSISEETVKTHMRYLRQQRGSTNTVAAVVDAYRERALVYDFREKKYIPNRVLFGGWNETK